MFCYFQAQNQWGQMSYGQPRFATQRLISQVGDCSCKLGVVFEVVWSFLGLTFLKLVKIINLDPLNPLTPKISLVILLTVCYTVLVMLVWRICYWINL